MTGMRSNVAELPSLVRLAAAAGIGEVYLQRLVHSERGLARRDQALVRGDEPCADAVVEGAIAEALRLAAEFGIRLNGPGEVMPGTSASASGAAPAIATRPWSACRRPTSLMYVTANGNVLPCCIAPFTGADYASLTLGDTRRMNLDEIWNGDRYREWRARMDSDDPPEACRGCGSAWAL
jgi:radical SAM protein with 4Fe4S-binding SPASM domain